MLGVKIKNLPTYFMFAMVVYLTTGMLLACEKLHMQKLCFSSTPCWKLTQQAPARKAQYVTTCQ